MIIVSTILYTYSLYILVILSLITYNIYEYFTYYSFIGTEEYSKNTFYQYNFGFILKKVLLKHLHLNVS